MIRHGLRLWELRVPVMELVGEPREEGITNCGVDPEVADADDGECDEAEEEAEHVEATTSQSPHTRANSAATDIRARGAGEPSMSASSPTSPRELPP